jgi:hypothetical protein
VKLPVGRERFQDRVRRVAVRENEPLEMAQPFDLVEPVGRHRRAVEVGQANFLQIAGIASVRDPRNIGIVLLPIQTPLADKRHAKSNTVNPYNEGPSQWLAIHIRNRQIRVDLSEILPFEIADYPVRMYQTDCGCHSGTRVNQSTFERTGHSKRSRDVHRNSQFRPLS